MKIIAVGDLHGKDDWKSINIDNYDKIIFIGDYVDAWPEDKTDIEIIKNLEEIIQLKRENQEKVVLLLGNHDLQYMFGSMSKVGNLWICSGNRPSYFHQLYLLFNDNFNLFQIAYQINKHLFTHAGVSNKWYDKNKIEIDSIIDDYKSKRVEVGDSLSDKLNFILQTSKRSIFSDVGECRGGIKGNYGSIIWTDRSETENDFLKDYHQVVGHTPIDEIITISNSNESITYIDVLDKNKNTFFELEFNENNYTK